MKVGSLFSGIGGFDLGLERVGMQVAWQVEKDGRCQAVLRCHWPDVLLCGDVMSVREDSLERVDVICGGFPCQDLSLAGDRAGLAGERSGLFFEFVRIAHKLAPRWVLIENVPGLLSSHGGRDMGAVLGALEKLGYGWAYRVLDAQYFGVAQRRRRVFIVGYLGSAAPAAQVLFEPESVSGSPAPREKTKEEVAPCVTTRIRIDGEGWELIADGERVRHFTPREAERLQGFPDGWTDGQSDTTRYRQLGNAVCVNVAEWIGRRMEGKR